jgi:hypothetical protein
LHHDGCASLDGRAWFRLYWPADQDKYITLPASPQGVRGGD